MRKWNEKNPHEHKDLFFFAYQLSKVTLERVLKLREKKNEKVFVLLEALDGIFFVSWMASIKKNLRLRNQV